MYRCMNEQQANNIQDSKITLSRMSIVIGYEHWWSLSATVMITESKCFQAIMEKGKDALTSQQHKIWEHCSFHCSCYDYSLPFEGSVCQFKTLPDPWQPYWAVKLIMANINMFCSTARVHCHNVIMQPSFSPTIDGFREDTAQRLMGSLC